MLKKPKKALRGLISRTEPDPERETRPASKAPPVKATAVKAAPIKAPAAKVPPAKPKLERPGASARPEHPTVLSAEAAFIPAPAPAPAGAEGLHMEETEPEAQVEATPAYQGIPPEHETPVLEALADVPAAENLAPMPRAARAEMPATLLDVRNAFVSTAADRAAWNEGQYTEMIRRIDAAQTDAFLLKGKLLAEMKRRFYEDSSTGWKQFCESSLHLNYTTANQYIRVATEFDVTSHQHPDFGFEHYKALLPLAPEDRRRVLEEIAGPERSLSVKQLRARVAETLSRGGGAPAPAHDPRNRIRSLLNQLEKLENALVDRVPAEKLTQQDRWQLSAAAALVAQQLHALSSQLGLRPMRVHAETEPGSANFAWNRESPARPNDTELEI